METSAAGDPIYRYPPPDNDFEPAIGDSENIEKISAHVERHIGPIQTVYHEILSHKVHIDVHVVAPRPERNFYTLVTSGMSDRRMNTPEGSEECGYAELMLCLPPDWPLGNESWKDNIRNYWPVAMLKFLARFPHQYQSWLWLRHTIPNGHPVAPFADTTEMCGAILLPPITTGGGFHQLKIDEGKTIHFHAAIPVHADEMELKLKEGSQSLVLLFMLAGVNEVIQASRPSSLTPGEPLVQRPVAAKKPWWKRMLE